MIIPSKPPKEPIISIIGTTGVGKSQLSIALAERFNGEIINADSMQMYKGLDQITNKHSIQERKGIVHHIMNHVGWDEQYYIHLFKSECLKAIDDIRSRGKLPIIVGGTHYYLQSVLFENKTIDANNRSDDDGDFEKKKNGEKELTIEELNILDNPDPMVTFNELKKIDPVISMKFHPNDVRRVRRALEIYYSTGKRASEVYDEQVNESKKKGSGLRFDTTFLWVYSKMDVLDERLDSRVNKMMHQGGLKELSDLYDFYLSKNDSNCKPQMDSGIWQVIGFKEFLPYLADNSVGILLQVNDVDKLLNEKDFKKCCDEMKIRTRRYARRQIKWIKNLLIPELKDEETLGFNKLSKLFLLDATNLENWHENVEQRGIKIIDQFLNLGDDIDIKYVPESLRNEHLIIDNDVKKDQDRRKNWVHNECNICTDKDTGKPLVFVGEQYEIHLKSKKHRTNLTRGKRKREYEEWLAKKVQT